MSVSTIGERLVYAIGVVNGLEITVIYTDRNEDESASSPRGGRSRTKGVNIGETS
jgi:hypothetical protein